MVVWILIIVVKSCEAKPTNPTQIRLIISHKKSSLRFAPFMCVRPIWGILSLRCPLRPREKENSTYWVRCHLPLRRGSLNRDDPSSRLFDHLALHATGFLRSRRSHGSEQVRLLGVSTLFPRPVLTTRRLSSDKADGEVVGSTTVCRLFSMLFIFDIFTLKLIADNSSMVISLESCLSNFFRCFCLLRW